ncbi:Cytokinesis protein sepH [Pelomyxa schiedti]|nr:Cytokinesis protein sepH [Pelomyxa schiedti]
MSDTPNEESSKKRETLDTPLGQITLGEEISGGLMPGVDVVKGLLTQHGEVVAIKRLPLPAFGSVVAQTNEELNRLKDLNDPHIIRMLGLHQDSKFLYVIQDYAENGSLLELVCEFGSLPEQLSTGYLQQALIGLKYLHSMHVIHRNLKAANVLVTKTGRVKLCDFSISALWHTCIGLEEMPHWKAPEVLSGGECTAASDIWSLGCTVVELLTGSPPFPDSEGETAINSILTEEIATPDCSADMQQFLQGCFNKSPADRPTAAALLGNKLFRSFPTPHSPDFHTVRRSMEQLSRSRSIQTFRSSHSPSRRNPTVDLVRAKQNIATIRTELEKQQEIYNNLAARQKSLQATLEELTNHYEWTKLGASTVFRKLKDADANKNRSRDQKKMIADWENVLVQYFYEAFPDKAPPEFPRTPAPPEDDNSGENLHTVRSTTPSTHMGQPLRSNSATLGGH